MYFDKRKKATLLVIFWVGAVQTPFLVLKSKSCTQKEVRMMRKNNE